MGAAPALAGGAGIEGAGLGFRRPERINTATGPIRGRSSAQGQMSNQI
jgi:hypothetical protein